MRTKEGKELIVSKIKNGTVIDHIEAGRALTVLKILGISGEEGLRVALVMNVESKKMGKKDIVKIENKELTPEEVNKIALVAPNATLNIIRNYEVVEKRKVVVPNEIRGIIKCTNPNCVTNQPNEPIIPKFKKISDKPIQLKCEYCGEILGEKEIIEQFNKK
ncbi:MAG: aspartate carbamoyltransferase regulatory subunit [Candidatus Micrarchaeia archaeon]